MFKNNKVSYSLYAMFFILLGLCLSITDAMAAGGANLGSIAANITSSFTAVAKLITAGSYLAGLGFSIGAIMKFKQHKDNPTQITIGTPIALLFMGAALLFLPSILSTAGSTMFGSSGGEVAGPSGTIIKGASSGS